MTTFNVPTRDHVSPANQALFDTLKKGLGMVPNLYATPALSEHALGNYLAFQNAKSSITGKAREVINLVVSQVNSCQYCLSAHTVIGGMVGFTPEQIIEIRRGGASFDAKLDALAKLVKNIALERGHDPATELFGDAGETGVERSLDRAEVFVVELRFDFEDFRKHSSPPRRNPS